MQPRDLSDHAVYAAGRGSEEVARELGLAPDELVTLSSNENPHGPSPAAAAAIREQASAVHTYPKSAHTDLTGAIADRWNVEPAQVWLANGGDGALDYLSRALLNPGDSVLVSRPGFAYYAMSARYHHGRVNSYELKQSSGFAQTPDTVLDAYDGERIVYLTIPHNPTGTTASLETIERIAAETDEETLIVVDEAYGEFASVESALALVEGREEWSARDDVAVLRTFSKAYGLAGVRLGYAVVPDEWAGAYTRVNTPFAASALACRAGLAALDDREHVERTVETVEWAREFMAENLDAHTYPSAGNFVLVDVGDATAVAEAAKRKGVVVRDCSSFGLSDCIRVSCGTEEETERAVEVINEVLA
ncbi:histidinol-phosphate transaminase [Halococcus sp. AFM35]|uniref:histidinol-phosphate transaminase n=1 Tax=Halococcus sp. AFM35 TaxID=3421653 RepID=UPI003EB8A33A